MWEDYTVVTHLGKQKRSSELYNLSFSCAKIVVILIKMHSFILKQLPQHHQADYLECPSSNWDNFG